MGLCHWSFVLATRLDRNFELGSFNSIFRTSSKKLYASLDIRKYSKNKPSKYFNSCTSVKNSRCVCVAYLWDALALNVFCHRSQSQQAARAKHPLHPSSLLVIIFFCLVVRLPDHGVTFVWIFFLLLVDWHTICRNAFMLFNAASIKCWRHIISCFACKFS